jgi:hypothetical protein
LAAERGGGAAPDGSGGRMPAARGRARAQAAALLSARATLVGGPFVLAFFSGGFFDGPRDIALLVAGVVLAVLAAVTPADELVPQRPAARFALVAAAAYAGWIALSATWAPVRDFAGDDAERALLYAVVLAAAAIAFRDRSAARSSRSPRPAPSSWSATASAGGCSPAS